MDFKVMNKAISTNETLSMTLTNVRWTVTLSCRTIVRTLQRC